MVIGVEVDQEIEESTKMMTERIQADGVALEAAIDDRSVSEMFQTRPYASLSLQTCRVYVTIGMIAWIAASEEDPTQPRHLGLPAPPAPPHER